MQFFTELSFIQGLVKTLQQAVYRAIKIAQYSLIVVFYTLLTTLSYLYLTSISKLQKEPFQMIIWLIIGVWIQFNMLFNYTMCVIVKPGSPNDINYSEIRHIEYKCKKCNSIKTPRSHHCSMCNSCIIQMDHHCPWIGQCVGHHNRSYFLNFITYTFFGLIILRSILAEYMQKPIYRQQIYEEKINAGLMFEAYLFVYTLIFVLGFFCLFHWYLALFGKTTIEFCFQDPRYTPSKSFLKNLRIIFGSDNILYYLLPKLSVLKMKGYQWEGISQNENNTQIQIQAINFPYN